MKVKLIIATTLIISFNSSLIYSQEWKNLSSYQKETGYSVLQDGCWLKKDRKSQNKVWNRANVFNLSIDNANRKYETISQIRDFYLWFDLERKKQGHEIKWIGIAAIAAGQLSKLDIGLIRSFVVRNKEIVKFANEGSESVFDFAFPRLKKVYFSNKILRGEDAVNWSLEFAKIEQCQILQPLYDNLSPAALDRLNKMAKGEGIFNLGIPASLKYVGPIEDCEKRIAHVKNKMFAFYLRSQKN